MKNLNRALALLAFLLVQRVAYGQNDTQAQTAQVEKNLLPAVQSIGDKPFTLQERMAHYKVHGLSIAVVRNHHIAWAKGYGWADDSLKVPVTTQTLFQAASISKSINSVGVLRLVQEGKLDLYTDINTYLKSWKFPYDSLSKGKKITIANLLSHTGGLTVHGFEGYTPGLPVPTINQILDGQKPANSDAIRSMYAPGLRSEYSGGGITISQLIVMDVTHQPYAEYMKRQVLQPLGMVASTYQQPPAGINPALLATGYRADGKPLPGKYNTYPEQAAAGLWTNPTDLSRYIIETQLAYEGKSARVLNQATTRIRLTPYLNQSAALGVFIDNLDSTKYFEHGGANEGFRCQYYGSLQGGNGVVVMVNSDDARIMGEIINSVGKVYGFKGLNQSKIKPLVTVSEAVLQSYVGEYELQPQFIIKITQEGGQLYGQDRGPNKYALYPETQTHFYPKEFNADLEFVKDASGKVTSLKIMQYGQPHIAKKVK